MMRRIILLLAMVTLLSVMAAVPAIAQPDLSSWWGIDPSTCDWYWSISEEPQYLCWSYFNGWVQPWG